VQQAMSAIACSRLEKPAALTKGPSAYTAIGADPKRDRQLQGRNLQGHHRQLRQRRHRLHSSQQQAELDRVVLQTRVHGAMLS
jgi:hypothetical protein